MFVAMKRFSIRRALRGSTAVVCVLILLAVVFVLRGLGFYIPDLKWYVSGLVAILVGFVDKQLPTRRYKNFALLLLSFGAAFTGFGVWRFIVKAAPLEADAWIVGILMLLSLGYGSYCLWRWRGSVLRYRDIVLQRELRARNRRKIAY